MSKRKKVCRRLDSIIYDSLQTVLERVDGIIKHHPELSYKDFSVDTYFEYGDESRPCLEYLTDETDEEVKKRLQFEESLRISNEERDRQTYERLRKMFE